MIDHPHSIRSLHARFLLAAALPLLLTVNSSGRDPSAGENFTTGSVTGVVNVMGLEGVRRNAKGTLKVEGGRMSFSAGKARASVGVASITDVFTGQDSQRVVGGKLGTATLIAVPYGGGRVISLFRQKIDLLTVEYRDENGGLHGAILTLPKGQAATVKKWLVAEGAHTTIPIEAGEKAASENKP